MFHETIIKNEPFEEPQHESKSGHFSKVVQNYKICTTFANICTTFCNKNAIIYILYTLYYNTMYCNIFDMGFIPFWISIPGGTTKEMSYNVINQHCMTFLFDICTTIAQRKLQETISFDAISMMIDCFFLLMVFHVPG